MKRGICEACPKGCKECTSGGFCKECFSADFTFDADLSACMCPDGPVARDKQSCTVGCPSTTVFVYANQVCRDCDDRNCLTCDTAMQPCTECGYNFTIQTDGTCMCIGYTIFGECHSCESQGSTWNGKECASCPEYCTSCDSTGCSQCWDTFDNVGGLC